MADEYDELSLLLLIFDIIIQSINIYEFKTMGLTKEDIISKIRPHLLQIDSKTKREYTYDDHYAYLENLILYLESNDAKPKMVVFISYNDPEFAKRHQPFRLLDTDIREDLVYFTVSLKIVNIFRTLANHNDIEDRIDAEKFLLEKQINEGNIDKTIDRTEQIINLSEEYVHTVSNIISSIRISYDSNIWETDQHRQLIRMEKNLDQWIKQNEEIHHLIRMSFAHIKIGDPDFYKIELLESNIRKSHIYFLGIYQQVKHAREVFLLDHWEQRLFTPEKTEYLNPDPDLVKLIANQSLHSETRILNHIIRYFQSPKIPVLHNYNKLFQYFSFGLNKEKRNPIAVENTPLTFSEEHLQFSSDTKENAIATISKIMDNCRPKTLSEIIQYVEREKVSYPTMIYIFYIFYINWKNPKVIPSFQTGKSHIVETRLSTKNIEMLYLGNIIIGSELHLKIKVGEL